MSNNKITVRVTVSADIQKVWNYYTQAGHITKWNFADPGWHCPSATNDMRVGGQYKARMEAKDGSFGFDFEAVYTEVNLGKNFTYEFGGRYATIVLTQANGQTEVVVTFDPETEHSPELQQKGWQALLNNFKNYVETN